MIRALLLAPPGAGKGTQGQRLADAYGVPHLATGDILREHVATGTEIGLQAEPIMERGDLVPDRLVVDLVLSVIVGPPELDGFILDGFPRTLEQATFAYEWGRTRDRTFDAVVSLDVPDDELVARLLERGRLAGRLDDNEETIRRRLSVYNEETAPLLDYYAGRGILLRVDGTGEPDDVTARIRSALDDLTRQ